MNNEIENLDEFDKILKAGCVVGLTGSAGSGKTTYSRFLMNASFARKHNEGVRDWVNKRNYGSFRELTTNQRVEVQLYLMDRFEQSNGNILDRTPLDTLAHAELIPNFPDIERFRDRARSAANRINVYLFFPYYCHYLIDDGVRFVDPFFQLDICARVWFYIVDFGLRNRAAVYNHGLNEFENLHKINEAYTKSASIHD
jgi:hypothetical protein